MGKGAEQKEHRYFCRTKAGWLTLCLLLLCVLLLSLRFGSSGMDWQSFFGGLLRQEGFEAQSVILYSLRLPRLLQGVLAGIGLSVSGVLLQSVTGNRPGQPEYYRRQRGRRVCSDFNSKLFSCRGHGPSAGGLFGSLSYDPGYYGHRQPGGFL